MRTLRCIIVLAAWLCTCAAANAQWGFRVAPYHWQTATGAGLTKQHSINLGLDHDLNDRLSIGVEVLIGLTNNSTSDYYDGSSGHYMGYAVDYTMQDRSKGFMYRCEYAFTDNDGFHGYLASTIGFVRVTRDLSVYNVTSPNSYYAQDPSSIGLKSSEENSGMVFPLGLRFGLRSDLEGMYIDMYTGAGVNLGSKELSTAPYLEEKEANMSGVFLQLGIALGFGS